MMYCFIDCETTGLESVIHGVVEFSYILTDKELDVKAKGTLLLNPLEYTHEKYISKKALEVNGYTIEQMKELPTPMEAIKEFEAILVENSNDTKYTIVGHNAQFDTGFMQKLFKKTTGRFGKLFTYHHLCTLEKLKWMKIEEGKLQDLDGYGLLKVASYFGIKMTHHRSDEDARATYEIFKRIRNGSK